MRNIGRTTDSAFSAVRTPGRGQARANGSSSRSAPRAASVAKSLRRKLVFTFITVPALDWKRRACYPRAVHSGSTANSLPVAPSRPRKTNVTRNLRDKIAELCLSHSGKILLISAFVLIAALAGASRLSFDPDILNLVPENNREINEFKKALRDMGTIDYHIVVLNLPAGHDASEYDTLIQSIANGYRKSGLIDDVDYRIPNPLDMIDLLLPRALLFLTPAELDQVGDALTDQAIRDSVARNRTLLQTPQSMAMKEIVRYDPFHLFPIFMKKFNTGGTGFRIDVTSGYYLSSDHTMLLILTKPKSPAQNVPFAKKLMAEKERIEKDAMKQP